MELQNSFVVPADIATTWSMLLDLESVAPCVPGSMLTGVNGDRVGAVVRVKLGPVIVAYEGEAVLVHRDDAAHRAVIEGTGREARGRGAASALVAMQLVEEAPERTRVDVGTCLTISGTAAQFGAAVLGEASRRVVDQFAGNVEHRVREGRLQREGAHVGRDASSSVGSLRA